jgi:DNA-binding NarL/FixJ family response regulator
MSGEYSIFGTPPGDTGRPPTVVIADDQALVRGGFRLILKAAGIDVVAEAADGAQAVAAVLAHRPDVVLMDVRMPVMDGIEATKRILAAHPDSPADLRSPDDPQSADDAAATGLRSASCCYQNGAPRIIILTTFDLDEYVYAALAAGASGFLLKDVTPEHLVAAVQLVRTGDALLAPSITRRLVERFAAAPVTSGPAHSGPVASGRGTPWPGAPGRGRAAGAGRPGVSAGAGAAGAAGPAGTGLAGAPARPGTACDTPALTPRELEVLGLVARGLSNAEIASELVLSEATVKTHVARILTKLGLRDRVQVVVLAYETGLVSPSAGSLQPHRPRAFAALYGSLLRLGDFGDRRREPVGGAQRQQVVGPRHQHGLAAFEPHGDRPADFGHHGVLKLTEQHRRRNPNLTQPAESRRPGKFQLTELEP